jgi:hypothetical protein
MNPLVSVVIPCFCDLEAMALLHRFLKPRAVMLLTIPAGIDAVFPPVL